MDVDPPEGSADGPEQDTPEDLASRRAEAEAGIAALQQKRQPTKVSQKKVDLVKVRPGLSFDPSHSTTHSLYPLFSWFAHLSPAMF